MASLGDPHALQFAAGHHTDGDFAEVAGVDLVERPVTAACRDAEPLRFAGRVPSDAVRIERHQVAPPQNWAAVYGAMLRHITDAAASRGHRLPVDQGRAGGQRQLPSRTER